MLRGHVEGTNHRMRIRCHDLYKRPDWPCRAYPLPLPILQDIELDPDHRGELRLTTPSGFTDSLHIRIQNPVQRSAHHKISGADNRADIVYYIKIKQLNIIILLLLCGGGGEIRTHEGR